MKILLINPPDRNTIVADNPSFLDEERGFNPPLGLLYIASYAKNKLKDKVDIKIIDAMVEELSYDQLKSRISEINPDLIGMTAMTMTLIDVVKTLKLIKEISKGIKIVLGGPHPTIFPEETILFNEVDYLITGEGEIAFGELLEALLDKKDLSKIKGLYYKDNVGKVFKGDKNYFIDDLDNLPFPDRRNVPYERYSSLIAKRSPITTIFTSRGCPFGCAFCDRPHMGRRFRARSSKNVVDEIEEGFGLGIKEFLFYDDTFTVNKERVYEICDEIKKRKLDIGWDIRARVDTIDEDMIIALKSANCERIHYGVEAGTDKVLKTLNKGITIDQVKKAFSITKKHGISTLAYFMIGSPGETREDILKTINFAKLLSPDYVHITITTPYPATKMYQDALSEGVIDKDYWREFAKDPSKGVKVRYWEKELKKEELFELLKLFYKKFYTRPDYLIKSLFKIRSFGELYRKGKAGLKVLKA